MKRGYIPKPDGRQRPLGVTVLEDKIAQRSAVEVLNAIYEVDFLGFSYGFRPGRSPHRALDALYAAIMTRKVSWVLDADIRGYFGSTPFRIRYSARAIIVSVLPVPAPAKTKICLSLYSAAIC